MSKHTPGPWSVVERKDCVEVRATNPAHGSIGISCYGFEAWKQGCSDQVNDAAETRNNEARANARLIAAAPDLLAALKELLGFHSSRGDGHGIQPTCIYCETAKAAITKAEGKS